MSAGWQSTASSFVSVAGVLTITLKLVTTLMVGRLSKCGLKLRAGQRFSVVLDLGCYRDLE